MARKESLAMMSMPAPYLTANVMRYQTVESTDSLHWSDSWFTDVQTESSPRI